MWTYFFDMSSGGSQKLPYKLIFIEAPEKAAIWIFKDIFDKDPEHVSCKTCGEDFSLNSFDDNERTINQIIKDFWIKDESIVKVIHKKEFTADQQKLVEIFENGGTLAKLLEDRD